MRTTASQKRAARAVLHAKTTTAISAPPQDLERAIRVHGESTGSSLSKSSSIVPSHVARSRSSRLLSFRPGHWLEMSEPWSVGFHRATDRAADRARGYRRTLKAISRHLRPCCRGDAHRRRRASGPPRWLLELGHGMSQADDARAAEDEGQRLEDLRDAARVILGEDHPKSRGDREDHGGIGLVTVDRAPAGTRRYSW